MSEHKLIEVTGYRVKVERVAIVEITGEVLVQEGEGAERKRTWVPSRTTSPSAVTIYEQTVEALDLRAVINAVNDAPEKADA